MKTWIAGILLLCSLSVMAGSLGLPVEHVAMGTAHLDNPNVQHLVCIWDNSAQTWLQDHLVYDHSGVYAFQVPEWDQWFWIGLWDTQSREYVFGTWVGQFK